MGRLSVAVFLAMFLCGCSSAQMRQEFLGYSIKNVQDSKNKHVTTYNMSAEDCFEKIKAAVNDNLHGTIAWEDRGRLYLIAMSFDKAFRSSINTTQVGILTTSLGDDKSQVEIASENPDLAAFVSKEIEKSLKGIREKEKTT